ncbi:Nitric oxide synthase, brain [Exaiptasia diaphana]|nr:Nitric oxide synthase, brain [Exaiptasia diaphana]
MTDKQESITSTKIVKHKVGGLGFLVKERSAKPCVTISSIVKGSTAEANGMLHEGDVILEINGKSLKDTEFTKALKILNDVAIGSTVALKLQAELEKRAQEKQATGNSQVNKNGTKSPTKTPKKKDVSVVSEKENKEEPVNGELVVVKPTANGDKQTNDNTENQVNDAQMKKEAEQQIAVVKKCPFSGTEVGAKPLKPVKLKNWETGKESLDTLHQKVFIRKEIS